MTSTAFAADSLPVPLSSKNPDQPLTIIQDHTATGKQLNRPLYIDEFFVAANQGAPTLIIDYAATRATDERGESSVDINLECSPACKIPLNKSVMTIRTEFMGEDALRVDGVAQHLWLTRGIYAFPLNAGTQVWGSLTTGEATHMQTQAIRMRWVYGTPDELRFPGQKTRSDLFLKISGSVLFLLALGWWLLRRN
ncbi:hypothetical protein [Pseudolysobacter antarcticus]|nr:hypothetical protein [Pseudolysobacter antarcticus]